MTPETTLTGQSQSSDSAAAGVADKRSPDGRQRPYKVLRVLAKVYSFAAPILAAIMAFNAGMAWFIEETVSAKFTVSLQFLIQAALIFLVMKAASQMIYLLFDIARGVNRMSGERQG